jgi:hypothetical protein
MRTIKTYSKGAPFYNASAPKKVAANLLILQGCAEPLSSAPVWAEPSQLLLGNWLSELHGLDFVSELKKERDDLNRAIAALEGIGGSNFLGRLDGQPCVAGARSIVVNRTKIGSKVVSCVKARLLRFRRMLHSVIKLGWMWTV